jgi:hypothetical protein
MFICSYAYCKCKHEEYSLPHSRLGNLETKNRSPISLWYHTEHLHQSDPGPYMVQKFGDKIFFGVYQRLNE